MTERLFRTEGGELRAPWRLALFGAVVFASATVVLGIGFSVGAATPLAAWARAARFPVEQWLTVLSLVLATWLTARLLKGEEYSVWRYVGLGRGSWSPRVLAVASSAGVLVIAVPVLALIVTGGARFEPSVATDSPVMVAWTAFALLAPAAVAEELLFRGYAFSACVDAVGEKAAIAGTSVFFALAHLANPDPTVLSMTAIAMAGVFLAVVRVATGSLVAAGVAHFWVNYTQAVVLHAPVSGLALQMPGYRFVESGPDWLTGGPWGPEASVGAVAALALASFLYFRRFRGTQTSTPAATS